MLTLQAFATNANAIRNTESRLMIFLMIAVLSILPPTTALDSKAKQ